MKIEDKLVASVISGLKALYGQEVPEKMVQLQKTKKEFEGHLTLVVFPFLKMSKKGPEQTAQEIGEYLKANDPAVAAFNVIKGFLNLTIASATWIELLNEIQADEQYGLVQVTDASPLVMIEYSSPNTNKPLHLGHVRNNLLGNALANIVAANGNKVVKTNIVNDRGIHICKSMLAWKKYGNGETPETSGKKGDHLVGDYYVSFDKHYKAEVKELMAKFTAQGMNDDEAKAKAEAESPLMQEAREMLVKWEAGDPEVRGLWEMMNNWVYAGFDETYKKMGVSFDKIYYESNTYLEGKEKVMEGLEKGFSIDLWAMPVQRPYNPNARRMAEMIQADWAKVGVQAKIVTYEWGEYLKRAKDGEHQTVMMGWTGDNGDPDNFFATLFSCAASEQGSNYSKWCYKPFEDLIQPARATDDHNKRVELYKQAQVVMHDQAPALIIAHSTVFEPVRKEVKGYVVDPLGKHHFENVSIE
jgi:hypothetical protein